MFHVLQNVCTKVHHAVCTVQSTTASVWYGVVQSIRSGHLLQLPWQNRMARGPVQWDTLRNSLSVTGALTR